MQNIHAGWTLVSSLGLAKLKLFAGFFFFFGWEKGDEEMQNSAFNYGVLEVTFYIIREKCHSGKLHIKVDWLEIIHGMHLFLKFS